MADQPMQIDGEQRSPSMNRPNSLNSPGIEMANEFVLQVTAARIERQRMESALETHLPHQGQLEGVDRQHANEISRQREANPGTPANAASKPFSFIDQYATQSLVQRLFFDSIDRIRKHASEMKAQTATIYQPSIPQAELILLHSLFAKELEKALQIIDDNKLSTFVGDGSNRVFWRVEGSSKETYLTTPFHCSCQAFFNQVVISNEKLYCKHQIAAIIADAIDHQQQLTRLSDISLGMMLTNDEHSQHQKSGWSSKGYQQRGAAR